jgi:hypothetical protein
MLERLGIEADIKPRSRQFIQSRISDNPRLLEADPQYLINLYNLPEDQRRLLLEGDWDYNPEQVFSNWRRDLHVVDPFPIPTDWFVLWRGIDWGFANPMSAGWYARHKDTGRIFRVQGLYGSGWTDQQQAKLILDKTPETWANYTTLGPRLLEQEAEHGREYRPELVQRGSARRSQGP